MKESIEQLKPVFVQNEEKLTEWLFNIIKNPFNSPSFMARNYDSFVDFLLDCLYEIKDQELSLKFGNASCKCLFKFFDEAEFSKDKTNRNNGNIVVDILFLVESLPCSHENADEVIDKLILLLASYSHRLFSYLEIDIRARMLLTLASKLNYSQKLRKEFALFFKDDLSDPNYVVPAYSVILRLDINFAAQFFTITLNTLRKNSLPIKFLILEISKVISAKRSEASSLMENIISTGDDEANIELNRILAKKGIDAIDKVEQNEKLQITQFSDPILEMVLSQAIASFNSPQVVGDKIGSVISEDSWLFVKTDKSRNKAIPVEELGLLIKNLDNGYWKDKVVFNNNKKIPDWFDIKSRRLIAAYGVKYCVNNFVEKEMLFDDEAFNEEIKRTQIPAWFQSVADLLKSNDVNDIKMAVSPFPEDILFYLILNKTAKIFGINFEYINTNWGQPISQDKQPDCALVNQWVNIPQLLSTSEKDDIYIHKGYYIFSNKYNIRETSSDRFKLAIEQGLERYRLGEYLNIVAKIKSNLNYPSLFKNGSVTNWSKDFREFITGEKDLYFGGSINARLLIRLWIGNTNRISILCSPEDFKEMISTYPSNRLIINQDFLKKIYRTKRKELKLGMISLYRAVGSFINSMANEAKIDLNSNGMKVIRYLMRELILKSTKQQQGEWNFVVDEKDMIDLILVDNDFNLS